MLWMGAFTLLGLGGISLLGWGALTLGGLGSITLPWMGGIVAGLGHTHDAEPPPGFAAIPNIHFPTWLLGAEERVPLVYIIMEICQFYPAPPSPKLFGHHNCPHHNSPALNDKNLIALSVSPLSSPTYIFFSKYLTENWSRYFFGVPAF